MGYADNLAEEFATVDLLLPSKTRTGRTDAFIISWVKVKKQIGGCLFIRSFNSHASQKSTTKEYEILLQTIPDCFFIISQKVLMICSQNH